MLLRIGNLLQTRRLHLELQGQNQLLEQRVRDRTTQLQAAHNEILQRLALAPSTATTKPTSTPSASANRRRCSARPSGCPTSRSNTYAKQPRCTTSARSASPTPALTHERPYKHAWPVERAVAEITAQRERQFDPDVVDTFLGLLDQRKLPTVGPMTQPELSAQTTSPKP